MIDLHARAQAAGLSVEWLDAAGHSQTVADDALEAILDALNPRDEGNRNFLSAEIDASFRLSGEHGPADLIFEDGSRRSIRVEDGVVPAIDTPGYHRLDIADRHVALAIAPRRCFRIDDAMPGRRIWAPAVQIPALRDTAPSAFGDFGTLASTARAFAKAGADALAISPIHALCPADATRFSPYAPSSREFLNVLFADPATIGVPMPFADSTALIDWERAMPNRLRDLRQVYDDNGARFDDDIAAFRSEGGEALEQHALFDALHAHFLTRFGAQGWQDWPGAFRDPTGTAPRRFAEDHGADVDFHVFLQWLAARSLEAVQTAARDAGMGIGLIADLAVGIDPGGSQGWSRPGDLLSGLSIGAPPDPLGPDGQSWGLTGFDPRALTRSGFAPFIATIRAALAHAGGIRIDHAFGLRRLWVIPDGATASDGAYLDMPVDDLIRIVAIESQRARAVVIGEDLGTVPDRFRAAMDEKAMLGMRVLWFERDEDGFVPPCEWARDAAAMTGTHDLPSVAGWWQGRDIDWTWALGRTASAIDEWSDRERRTADRAVLWKAFKTGMPQPADEDSAPVVDAAVAHIAATPSVLAILPIEDLAGLVEQPNLPGTIDEHPNWRRRMPDATDALLARSDVAVRIDALNAARPK